MRGAIVLLNIAGETPAVFHLAGEQALPVYFGIRQFDRPLHVIAVTKLTRGVAKKVQAVLSESGLDIRLLVLDAYDLKSNIKTIRAFIEGTGSESWLFNLTGGTKPMFAAAYLVSQQKACRAFYIETTSRNVDWLSEELPRESLKPSADSVDLFMRLAGYETRKTPEELSGIPEEARQGLLNAMWAENDKIKLWYRDMSCHSKYSGVPFKEGPRNMKGLTCSAQLKGPEDGYEGALTVGKQSLTHRPWPTLAKFICGGWLEEFVHEQVCRLHKDGRMKDIAKNLLAVTNTETTSRPVQEFDLLMTDGFCLTVVECKAGRAKQEHVQKLENLRQTFGGHFGRGVMVVSHPNDLGEVQERIARSGKISAITVAALIRDPSLLLTCKDKDIVLK